jgi:hypothetical protein
MSPRAIPAVLALAALAAAVAGCAKREPPSGGPPDVEPPRLIGSRPDSGAAGVPRDTHIAFTFSEGMEPRSTGEAVSIAPPVPIRQRRWSGRTLTLVLERPLDLDHIYTVFVSGTAHDRHGNPMGTGATVVFTTGASFPPGRIEGDVEARGMEAPGVYLWCYAASRKGVPDSTGRDFDALGQVDAKDAFRVAGLPVPGSYRLWAFADLNFNRSFEPDNDVLTLVDTTFVLTEEQPIAREVKIHLVNPRALGKVHGTAKDTIPDSLGVVRVLAVAAEDSTLRSLADVDKDGAFEFGVRAGDWWVRAFRDADRNAKWQPERERASEPVRIKVEAAGETEVNLRLRPTLGGP